MFLFTTFYISIVIKEKGRLFRKRGLLNNDLNYGETKLLRDVNSREGRSL